MKKKSNKVGVSWANHHKKWCSSITVDRKVFRLGYFSDVNDAIRARVLAEERHGVPSTRRRTDALTQRRLKELLSYDPETGEFVWRVNSPSGASKAGDKAIKRGVNGAIPTIHVDGNNCNSGHLAWLYQYGVLPSALNHINHDYEDIRIGNLLEIRGKSSRRNVQMGANNTSGVTGVKWHKTNKRWIAEITVNRKYVYLGSFEDKEDAIEAKRRANVKYGFHENHGKSI